MRCSCRHSSWLCRPIPPAATRAFILSRLLASFVALRQHQSWPIANLGRKWNKDDDHQPENAAASTANVNRKLASREALDGIQNLSSAAARRSPAGEPRHEEHVPHSICAYPMTTSSESSHALTPGQIRATDTA